MKHCWLKVWMAAWLVAAGGAFAAGAGAADASSLDARKASDEAGSNREQIARLIERLGAADFAEREQAQAELARLGLEAFDSLIDAQKSDDIEIQLRAKYLVRGLSVRWHVDGDSPDVVRVLKGYGDAKPGDRLSRMNKLAKLPDRQGLAALCRLTRFEIDPELSKKAALLVMSLTPPEKEAERAEMAKTIVATVGNSRRPASDWLRILSRTIEQPEPTLAEWDAIIRKEQELLPVQPDQTSREIVRDLYRWQVALLQKLERDDEAVAVIRRTITLLDGTTEQVTEIVNWLVEREAWEAVQEVADRFPGVFNDSALLLYRLAETQLKTGKEELAEQTARKSLELKSSNIAERIAIGYELQKRGLFDWAEREYRAVSDNTTVGSRPDFLARLQLSELLHDHAREKDAADVLQPLADLMDKDDAAKAQAENTGRDQEAIYARLHFFRALQATEENKQDQAREQYLKALTYDKTDADVLIALYRLKNTPEQAADIKARIEDATETYRSEIEEFSESLEGATIPQEKAIYSAQVATSCNQFAWLVSNTFGDFDEALRASHRSLDLRPDTAGYLDTLGRCYYAKGDLANAAKYQRKAVELDAHSRAIQRQLEQFEKELKEKGEAKAEGTAASEAKDS